MKDGCMAAYAHLALTPRTHMWSSLLQCTHGAGCGTVGAWLLDMAVSRTLFSIC